MRLCIDETQQLIVLQKAIEELTFISEAADCFFSDGEDK